MADGKSLVPLTITTIGRGVAIMLVPLIDLGSDQVGKAIVVDKMLKHITSMSTNAKMQRI